MKALLPALFCLILTVKAIHTMKLPSEPENKPRNLFLVTDSTAAYQRQKMRSNCKLNS